MGSQHIYHHADPGVRQAKKETIIKHISTGKSMTSYQVTGLALELSRKSDGTIDLGVFERNCDLAFEILNRIQVKLELGQEESNTQNE